MKAGMVRIWFATVSALAMLAAGALPASGHRAALPAPKPEPRDTTMHSATKSLIESVGELSRTAGKLSETALKLLEAQEDIDKKQESKPRRKVYIEPDETPAGRRPVYIEEPQPAHIEEPQPAPIEEQQPAHIEETTEEVAEEEPEMPAYENNGVYIEQDSLRELGSLWDLPQENGQGGRYIWVPDDKTYIVESVLEGSIPKGAYKRGEPNLNELTYWRGDSIPMAIPTKRLGRYDRKLYNWLIYPKGLWHIGLSANYGELSTQDSEFLSLIDDVDLGGTIYSIKPAVSYFFRNNLCMGLRLAYTKGQMGVDSFKVDIDEDMSFNLHDISYLSENYSAALYIQQYFGLSRRGRFAVYNEIELSVGSGNTLFTRPYDGEMRETRTKTKRLNINYSPGVSILVMKNAAINLSFGVFGFHLRKDKQWENGEMSGDQLTSGINFRFNIFNINFGVAVVI